MGSRKFPDIPDGVYAVADPDGRLTTWSVANGRLRDYPPDARWRPLPPPRPEHVPRAEHDQWRQSWYDQVYFPWVDEIVSAIRRDPAAAAAAAAELYPGAVPPRKQPSRRVRLKQVGPTVGQRERAQQALQAAALAATGMKVRRVAETLGVSPATASRWIKVGRKLMPGATGGLIPPWRSRMW